MQKQEEYENNWCWKQLLDSFLSDETHCLLFSTAINLSYTNTGASHANFV